MEDSIVTSNKKISGELSNHGTIDQSKVYTGAEPVNPTKDYTYQGTYQVSSGAISELEPYALDTLILEEHDARSDSDVTISGLSKDPISVEDSSSLINNIFHARDFIPLNETWTSNEIINSRIINADNQFVYTDCVVDMNNMIFEQRQFPRELFSNFRSLETGNLAIIKLKAKSGTFRIDVYPGEGIVDPALFDISDDIKELKDLNPSTKLPREW
ncbi:MAG: hypothetical protein HKO81_06575 [Flavobacteriaceae bacterium]|nr:hypothetical protein [Bacteroidia bacterium]NNL16290.1 hypothetical protein [Flavobacteriaceae bacterium]